MDKIFNQSPLPFQGQKRRFVADFRHVIANIPDGTLFVDLFGGSGLLSHVVKHDKPQSTVIYNDYDNYTNRIAHITDTNRLIDKLRAIISDTPKGCKISLLQTDAVLDTIKRTPYVDYVTI